MAEGCPVHRMERGTWLGTDWAVGQGTVPWSGSSIRRMQVDVSQARGCSKLWVRLSSRQWQTVGHVVVRGVRGHGKQAPGADKQWVKVQAAVSVGWWRTGTGEMQGTRMQVGVQQRCYKA